MRAGWTLLLAPFLLLLYLSSASVQPADYSGDTVVCHVDEILMPESTEEVSILVRDAAERVRQGHHTTIRASRPQFHSNNQMACPAVPGAQVAAEHTLHIHLSKMNKVFGIDPEKGQVHVGAGMLLKDLLAVMQANGLSFPAMATTNYDSISLGGMVANAAHGSHLGGRSFFASNVAIATWVDGQGTVHKSSDLRSVSGGLGLTGIITELLLQAGPMTKTRVSQHLDPDADIMARLGPLLEQRVAMQVLWRPTFHRVYFSIFEELPSTTPSDDARLSLFDTTPEELSKMATVTNLDQMDVLNKQKDIYTEAYMREETGWFATPQGDVPPTQPVVGWTNAMTAAGCPESRLCYWNAVKTTLREVSIPLSDLPEALRDIRAVADTIEGHLPWGVGVWIRFAGASSDWLSTAYGRDSAFIEMCSVQGKGLEHLPMKHQAFYEEVEQLLLCKYQGRPHYGKSTNRMLTSPCPLHWRFTLPQFDNFLHERERADPHGLFKPPIFKHIEQAVEPQSSFYPGCALRGDCYCKEDIHCHAWEGGVNLMRCVKGSVFPEARVCVPHDPLADILGHKGKPESKVGGQREEL
ncbi:hypothetical protein DUNSADRAFT_3576 [Dunaliella salina]|uniref:FAD-binding PCMH-type domain-containing protein n=1 Tax=Dunaliella salina TaxID=3046 RepID=A0ABQ7H800_DUNSA|nr:hypothetical protein DUNSADRAFT_3576 [Dunaliella salina]|eukprot:KAF5842983.1 hypothetical protein DUNSADRAFT_3576 [Dunaliella salina]